MEGMDIDAIVPNLRFCILAEDDRTPVYVQFPEWLTWVVSAEGISVPVKQERVGGRFVSTVFLSQMASRHHDDPRHFETLVDDGETSEVVARYATWEQAETGHADIVASMVPGPRR